MVRRTFVERQSKMVLMDSWTKLRRFHSFRKHQRISQVGTQHHAREEHRRVIEYIRSGNLGPIGVTRAFNVMNQTPRGIGTGGYQKLPEGIDWDLWCGPGPLGRYNRKLTSDAYHHCS